MRPKLFQALRATRETERAGKLPLHVVTAWCGNTPTEVLRHYVMTTGEHFDQGAQLDVAIPDPNERATRNPARYTSELAGTGRHETKKPCEIPLDSTGFYRVLMNECPGEDLNLHVE